LWGSLCLVIWGVHIAKIWFGAGGKILFQSVLDQGQRVCAGSMCYICVLWWLASHPGCITPRKDPATIAQEARWSPGPVWMCATNLAPTGIRSPDRPACSQSLYRLSYQAHLPYTDNCKLDEFISTYNVVPTTTHQLCRNPIDVAWSVLRVQNITPYDPVTLYQYRHLLHYPQKTGRICVHFQQCCQLWELQYFSYNNKQENNLLLATCSTWESKRTNSRHLSLYLFTSSLDKVNKFYVPLTMRHELCV
jgi:hypothetical protein